MAKGLEGVAGLIEIGTVAVETGTLMPDKYYECVKIGNEIKEAIDRMRNSAPSDGNKNTAAPADAAREEKTCPNCGAKTFPDANGCCEYCGSKI